MAITKSMPAKQTTTLSKREIRDQIMQKIEKALSDVKAEVGEKDFKKRIRKAAKVMAAGLHKPKAEVLPVVKAAKAVVKKAAEKIVARKAVKTVVKKASSVPARKK